MGSPPFSASTWTENGPGHGTWPLQRDHKGSLVDRTAKARRALDARDCVLAAIKKKLQENGVDLPFPTQQILFHDQTEEIDGDRLRQREGWPAGKGAVPRPAGVARVMAETAAASGKKDGGEADVSPGRAL